MVQNLFSAFDDRVRSLDVLRGIAILAMVLSGVIPYGVLPAYMYHAQIPPPTHHFQPDLPGLTWVDLVFPFFLFALGAALPLALGRRLARGESPLRIAGQIGQRTLLLASFAIILQHIRPHVINPQPDRLTWLTALLGFVLLFPLYTRISKRIARKWRLLIRTAGWISMIALLGILHYPDGSGFSLYRSDIILVVLTNCIFFGGLLWLVTRNHPGLRLALLGFLLALRLTHDLGGASAWIWNFSPLPWIYRFSYLKYLFIVLPATVVGDLLAGALSRETDDPKEAHKRWMALSWFVPLFLVFCLVGLQNRWVWPTLIVTLVLAVIMVGMQPPIRTPWDKLYSYLLKFGLYWLLLGLVFEPFEGGIKKDHSTLSYYFVSAGLATLLLLSLMVWIDQKGGQKGWSLLIDAGQNPMIAYVGIANAIQPVFHLTRLQDLLVAITPTPWLGFLRALFLTFLLALLTRFFTRRRIFWRT
ncbi:DUF5009 domain-containing protein [candidate division KSB1 bacterium]|nr:DUF5009 domain-containing protein [candidate division KSB1 bacterium]